MTTTAIPAAQPAAATVPSGVGNLASLIRGTRTAVAQNKDWAATASLVVGQARRLACPSATSRTGLVTWKS